MSKGYLKELMNDRKEESIFFSKIKQEWVRSSAEKASRKVWSKHINPSAHWFTFTCCPYEGVREASKPAEGETAVSIQRMEIGSYMHDMFQTWARSAPGLLWDDKSVERSFFVEEYALSGRADLILRVDDKPVLGELKIPQKEEGWAWNDTKRKLPYPSHIVQAVSCAFGLNMLKATEIPIKEAVILYFCPCVPAQTAGAYVECRIEITDEMNAKMKTLLEHCKRELDNLIEGKESYCTYPFCEKHAV